MHTMSISNRSKIENQMNNDALCMLEKIFYAADKGGRGRLGMGEFEEAMRTVLKDIGSDELDDGELEILFMKVDTDCDGLVDFFHFFSLC